MKINTKALKYGSAATAITVAVIAVIVLVNVIVTLFADRYNMSFDLTPGSDFAISDETKDYLASLTEHVEICTTVDEMAFRTSENKYLKQAYEVLKKYTVNSDKITLNFVDMTVDPTYVEKYKEYYSGSITENSIILFNEDKKRIRVISVNDLFNIERSFYGSGITSSKAEKTLTSGIMYITDPNPQTAVYLDAASESASGGNIITLLEDDSFDVLTVDPLTEEIPADADLIVINSPLNDFSEELVDRLYSFMENDGKYGKNMIYIASIYQNETPNIDAFLAEWGVSVTYGGVVSDNNTQNIISGSGGYGFAAYIGDAGTYSSGDGAEIDYTAGVPAENIGNPVAVYYARPVELLFSHSGNVTAYSLLNTANTGFVYTKELGDKYAETGEMPAIEERAVPLMTLSNKYVFIDNKQYLSNLIVLSSDEILSYNCTSRTYFNNGDYFLSVINKISGKENGIDIVDKSLTGITFQPTEKQFNSSRIVFMFVLPAAVAVCGIAVWLRRRHR